jgi:L-alanine-DL-glutamate epimerase-like enolase superfamily enzyme
MSATAIQAVEIEPLDIPLLEPFVIAIGQLDHVRNVLVTVRLENGVIGYGEAAPLEPISGENQATVLATLQVCAQMVKGRDVVEWRKLAAELKGVFGAQAAARAGLEMALLDALTKTMRLPLYQFLGGASSSVVTDLSIPIVEPARAYQIAAEWAIQGGRVLKIKVGKSIEADVKRVLAVKAAAPDMLITLDANQGYNASQAVALVEELAMQGVRIILFEQPVPKNDWLGLRFVTEHGRIPVAADETVFHPYDALQIAAHGAANVVNIKLMKCGLVDGLDIAAVCRAGHVGLMIGGMIESKLAMCCSAHFAAGLGGFEYIDLDTPMLMAENPFEGGYIQQGSLYKLDHIQAGLGIWPKGRAPGFLQD